MITPDLTLLRSRIETTIASHPVPRKRWQAMRLIRWCLYCPQLHVWAGMDGMHIVPVTSLDDAQKFDGRDNEIAKLDFYSSCTGIMWQVQLI